MSSFTNFLRSIVKKHPELKLKLKMADLKLSPFQYVYQTVSMTVLSYVAFAIIIFLFTRHDWKILIIGELGFLFFIPLFYKFWLSYVNVQIKKLGRDLDGDLLFVSEYLLVSLESGLPLGNAVENLARIKRPGGRFFKRIFTEFKTGKSFGEALEEGSVFSASYELKTLIKKLSDSMNIGVDLRIILDNFILDSSEKKLIEVKAFATKLNPVVMMYLLMGIVLPSLGVTFFMLAVAMMGVSAGLLKYILIFIFLIMFAFQYFAYSTFKFSKSTI